MVAASIQDDLEHVVGYTIIADAGIAILGLAALDPAAWEPARTWILVFVTVRSAFAAWAVAVRGRVPDPPDLRAERLGDAGAVARARARRDRAGGDRLARVRRVGRAGDARRPDDRRPDRLRRDPRPASPRSRSTAGCSSSGCRGRPTRFGRARASDRSGRRPSRGATSSDRARPSGRSSGAATP